MFQLEDRLLDKLKFQDIDQERKLSQNYLSPETHIEIIRQITEQELEKADFCRSALKLVRMHGVLSNCRRPGERGSGREGELAVGASCPGSLALSELLLQADLSRLPKLVALLPPLERRNAGGGAGHSTGHPHDSSTLQASGLASLDEHEF